eukprot:GHVT01058647.1.p1 GENE.GHVT01058647.1~~GHVT01058647.1.p1  ORF type:complete len:325 (+),score=66.82 GHVT01058647.1:358-1332(+)
MRLSLFCLQAYFLFYLFQIATFHGFSCPLTSSPGSSSSFVSILPSCPSSVASSCSPSPSRSLPPASNSAPWFLSALYRWSATALKLAAEKGEEVGDKTKENSRRKTENIADQQTDNKDTSQSAHSLVKILRLEFFFEEVKQIEYLFNIRKLTHEAKQLQGSALGRHWARRVVLGHNDFYDGNVLQSASGEIHLIDFEYADYNWAAYDLATLFTELMIDLHAPQCDFLIRPDLYPSEARRRQVIKSYLSSSSASSSSSSLPSSSSLAHVDLDSPEVSEFLLEVERLTLACHLLWGFWGVLRHVTTSSASSSSTFDYLSYAIARWV